LKEENKFGDKHFGRTSIERLIILLEQKGILRPVINLFFLIILVGVNSQVHLEPIKGVQFLIIIFLILYSGNESTTNFFGAAALAVFIIIHLSMFGFNVLALILTFTIFLLFRKTLEKNLLGPISIYLFMDAFFIYFKLQFTDFFISISNYLFSRDAVIILSLIPATYFFIIIERGFKKNFSNSFINSYGVFIVFGSLFGISFLIGIISNNSLLKNFSLVPLMFYFLGSLMYQKDLKKFAFILLPMVIIILTSYLIKLQFQ
jgi:hypothetical protein